MVRFVLTETSVNLVVDAESHGPGREHGVLEPGAGEHPGGRQSTNVVDIEINTPDYARVRAAVHPTARPVLTLKFLPQKWNLMTGEFNAVRKKGLCSQIAVLGFLRDQPEVDQGLQFCLKDR